MPVGFPSVARKARADDIFPGHFPSFVPREDMVEVELVLREDLGAILAGVFVAKKNILPGEFHLFAGDTVVDCQNDNFRHPESHFDRTNEFRRRRGPFLPRILNPGTDIMGLVKSLPFRLNHLGMTKTKKFEGTPDRTCMDRLPQPVED
jgi:hypothetical protein